MRKDIGFHLVAALAILFVVLMLFATSVRATVNLPLSCKAALGQDLKCAEANYQYVPGKAGLLIATPSGVWTLWEVLADVDDVRVCPRDIEPGSICPTSRITVKKAAATATVIPSTTRITYKWNAVTLDELGTPLPAGEIVGYQLTWWPKETPSQTQVINTGNVMSFTLTVPRGAICAALAAEGKSAFSNSTASLCLDPSVIKPAIPSGFTGEVIE